MARAPFVADIVHDQGAAHAFDRARGEAVPAVGRGDEDQTAVRRGGRAGDQFALRRQQVRAPCLAAGAGREIDQVSEQLDPDVGVRLQPETFGVEALFDAQIAAGE